MLDARLIPDERVDALLELTIGLRHTRVLPDVLRPRANDERFDVSIRVLGVVIQAPARRAITTPDVFVFLHRVHKRDGVVSVDRIRP